MKKIHIFGIASVIGALAILASLILPEVSQANVITQGIIAQFYSASVIPVGPQAPTIIAPRMSNCTNRVIGTASTTLMVSFGGVTPSALVGHWQNSSTTSAYENGTYGCGPITVWANASSTVTVTTFAQ